MVDMVITNIRMSSGDMRNVLRGHGYVLRGHGFVCLCMDFRHSMSSGDMVMSSGDTISEYLYVICLCK